jgi:hypothetical protein
VVVEAFATFPTVEELELNPTFFEVVVNRTVVNTRSVTYNLCVDYFTGWKNHQGRILCIANGTRLYSRRWEGIRRASSYTANGAKVNVATEVDATVVYFYPLGSSGSRW